MKYLITGGCGFIGSHIAEALVSEGHEVICYDNLSSGYEKNIAHIRDKVKFVKADVRDLDTLYRETKGVDFIFHEAALVSVFESVDRPFVNNEVNITGMLNVLAASRANGVKRVVVASSAAVYGNNPELPKVETMRPEPESPYAIGKITDEYYMQVFAKLYGVQTVCLRYFNVYGPRQDPTSMYSGVISKFSDVLKSGAVPTIFGDGQQTRDFVFVKDIVKANLLAMRTDKAGMGEVFNIATGATVSLVELLETMCTILGRKVAPVFKEARAGDIRHSSASIDKAVNVLGYKPDFTIEKGLRALFDYKG
ncbi:MAG: SDR family oxidoreductase [Fibrobacteres bacterium]|nr:SDR family oxidoreductase [Fibrobacterota bacterium]